MNRKWIAAIGIYIGLFAVCVIALYAVPSVKGMLERTYIAEYGTIDVSDEVSAFIVRDEKVYAASQPSLINRIAEEGRLYKAKTRIVELTPDEAAIEKEAEKAAAEAENGGTEEKPVGSDTGKYSEIMTELGDSVKETGKGYNSSAGYVSYYIDGAESKLSTKSLDKLTRDDFRELTGRRSVETADKKCGAGYPVFKIVKNSKWYLVYYISNEDAAKYNAGDAVTIDIDGEPVDVKVSQVLEGDKDSRITLSCKSFFDGFLDTRTIDTTVNLVSAEGLVLRDSSIVETPDGKRGVFVKNKLGRHVFKPISAKADDGEKCVVYSDIYVDAGGNFVETISTYDEVIADPTDEDLKSVGIEPEADEEAEDGAAAEEKTEQ